MSPLMNCPCHVPSPTLARRVTPGTCNEYSIGVIVIPDEEKLALMAAKFRILADASRLAIIHCLLTHSEMSVGQVVEATGRSQANVSKHLKLMAEAGLLARRKEGLVVF